MISYLGDTTAQGAAVPQVVAPATPLPVALTGGAGATVTQGPGNTASPWAVQGPVAAAVATSGNPVKAGGVYNTVIPTYLTGQQTELQTGSRGSLNVTLFGADLGAPLATMSLGIDNLSNSRQTLLISAMQYAFNGTSWDRLAKTAAPFKLPVSAATTNAASVKAAAGTVQGFSAFNTQAVTRYAKLFNTSAAPNPAVLAQFDLIALPQGPTNIVFGPGEFFSVGIGFAIVANPADLDNTAIGAGDITACVVRFS